MGVGGALSDQLRGRGLRPSVGRERPQACSARDDPAGRVRVHGVGGIVGAPPICSTARRWAPAMLPTGSQPPPSPRPTLPSPRSDAGQGRAHHHRLVRCGVLCRLQDRRPDHRSACLGRRARRLGHHVPRRNRLQPLSGPGRGDHRRDRFSMFRVSLDLRPTFFLSSGPAARAPLVFGFRARRLFKIQRGPRRYTMPSHVARPAVPHRDRARRSSARRRCASAVAGKGLLACRLKASRSDRWA